MNSAQIQALIDMSNGITVLPAGPPHQIDKPLRLNRPGQGLAGDPSGGTVLKTTQNAGLPVIFIGPVLPVQPKLFDGQLGRWINLRDTYSCELDGLSSLVINFDLNLNVLPPSGEDQVILSSGGSMLNNNTSYSESLRLSVLNGNLVWKLTTSSGIVSLFLPIISGQMHVNMNFSGSTATLTINGISKSYSINGPVKQGFFEDFTLGSDIGRWPDNVSRSRPINGTVSNFNLFGNGVNLISIPSLINITDQMIPCMTSFGPCTLFVRLAGVTAGINGCSVKNLEIEADHGHGLLVSNCQNSSFEGLNVYGRQGITLWNNAYKNTLDKINIQSTYKHARYGLGLVGACSLCKVNNIQVQTAGVGIVAEAASGGMTDCFVYGGTMQVGLLIKGDGNWFHGVRNEVSDEGQNVPGVASVVLSNLGSVLIESGGTYLNNSPKSPFVIDQVKATSLIGHQIGGMLNTPSMIKNTNSGKIIIQSGISLPSAIPLASDLSNVIVQG